jgi:hypothetical protein
MTRRCRRPGAERRALWAGIVPAASLTADDARAEARRLMDHGVHLSGGGIPWLVKVSS